MKKNIPAFMLALALLLTGCGAPPAKGGSENSNIGQEPAEPAPAAYTWQEETTPSEWKSLLLQMPLYDESFASCRSDELCTVSPYFGKENWINKNVLSTSDALYVYTSFFSGFNADSYPWFDGEVNGSYYMGKAIPAADIEDCLIKQADKVFGIGKEELHGVKFYLPSQKAYVFPSGLGGGGDDTYRIEKIITVDNYAIVLQRKWDSWNGSDYDWNLRAKKNGAITVLYQDSGDDYYHYLSNYCVKEIDRYLKDPAATNSTVQQPAGTESAAIRHITAEDGLRLRTGAGTSYDTIYTLPYGCPVVVHHAEKDWCYVEFNGTYGWMSSEYLAA